MLTVWWIWKQFNASTFNNKQPELLAFLAVNAIKAKVQLWVRQEQQSSEHCFWQLLAPRRVVF